LELALENVIASILCEMVLMLCLCLYSFFENVDLNTDALHQTGISSFLGRDWNAATREREKKEL
jgi:hypothetical protein